MGPFENETPHITALGHWGVPLHIKKMATSFASSGFSANEWPFFFLLTKSVVDPQIKSMQQNNIETTWTYIDKPSRNSTLTTAPCHQRRDSVCWWENYPGFWTKQPTRPDDQRLRSNPSDAECSGVHEKVGGRHAHGFWGPEITVDIKSTDIKWAVWIGGMELVARLFLVGRIHIFDER